MRSKICINLFIRRIIGSFVHFYTDFSPVDILMLGTAAKKI